MWMLVITQEFSFCEDAKVNKFIFCISDLFTDSYAAYRLNLIVLHIIINEKIFSFLNQKRIAKHPLLETWKGKMAQEGWQANSEKSTVIWRHQSPGDLFGEIEDYRKMRLLENHFLTLNENWDTSKFTLPKTSFKSNFQSHQAKFIEAKWNSPGKNKRRA